jgi:hypothetical protein
MRIRESSGTRERERDEESLEKKKEELQELEELTGPQKAGRHTGQMIRKMECEERMKYFFFEMLNEDSELSCSDFVTQIFVNVHRASSRFGY